MGAVLDRMIQRTRGPLSSVEPRSLPRFAPARAVFDSAAIGDGESLIEESRAVRPAIGSAAVPAVLRESLGRRGTDKAAIDPEPPAGPVDHVTPRPFAERSPLATAATRPDPGPDDVDSVRPRAEQPLATRSARPGDHDSAWPRDPVDGVPPPRTPSEPAEQRAADPTAGSGETGTTSNASVTRQATPAASVEAQSRSRPEAIRPQTAPDELDARPEVTILIGHIEVRAAPASEPPRARAPFRPRVTLDDFLDQQGRQR
jgi:hypothetical protein